MSTTKNYAKTFFGRETIRYLKSETRSESIRLNLEYYESEKDSYDDEWNAWCVWCISKFSKRLNTITGGAYDPV